MLESFVGAGALVILVKVELFVLLFSTVLFSVDVVVVELVVREEGETLRLPLQL